MSEVSQWASTVAGNAVAFDDIDNRDGRQRAQVKQNFKAIMAAVKRANGSGGYGKSLISAGALGDNATDNTTALAAMLAAAPAKASFFATPNADGSQGVYLLNTMTTAKAFELGGVGEAMLRGKTGSTALLSVASDPTFPEDGASRRYVHDLEFDGGVAFGSHRAGCVGLKWGDTASSVVHNTDERLYVHGFDVGVIDYSTQQATSNNNRIYRNNWGRLSQSDPVHGGATASRFHGNTYQLNHVGRVLDTTARFNLATIGTLSNSSTAVTAVASTAGIASGMKITGPGILPGTTVASFVANTSITLSQATSATAAMAKVPLRIFNAAGFGAVWQESDALFQANGRCGLAIFGMDCTLERPYFEGNYQPLVVGSATLPAYSARSIPVSPVYVEGARLTLIEPDFNEYSAITAPITLAAGAELYVMGGLMDGRIVGDLTTSVSFFGKLERLYGVTTAHVARWPDRFVPYTSSASLCAAGVPLLQATVAVKNDCPNANPRVPLLENPSGGAVVSYVRDATMGPVSAVQFAASVGSLGSNSVDSAFLNGAVTKGDVWARVVYMRADSYTNVSFQVQGAGSTVALAPGLPVTPEWRRVVLVATQFVSDSAIRAYMYPTAGDGPKIYMANEQQLRATGGIQDGGAKSASVDVLSEVVCKGLFNDKNGGTGALVGTATYDPGSIAAGASVTTTVSLNGVALGDVVSGVSFSLDTQGVEFEGYVSAANTVTVRLSNPTAGAIDLASGTVRVVVQPA